MQGAEKILLTAVVFAASCLAACPGKTGAPAAAAAKPAETARPAKPADSEKTPPPVTMKPASSRPGASAAKESRDVSAQVRPQSAVSRDDPLFGFPGPVTAASDFTLGVLQSPYDGNADDREGYACVVSVLSNLMDGRDIAEFLHPDQRERLLLMAEEGKKAEIRYDSFRIGKFTVGKDGVREVPVLLFGMEGRSSGKLLLEKKDSSFYLSGIVLDPFRLKEVHKKDEASVFDPSPRESPFR